MRTQPQGGRQRTLCAFLLSYRLFGPALSVPLSLAPVFPSPSQGSHECVYPESAVGTLCLLSLGLWFPGSLLGTQSRRTKNSLRALLGAASRGGTCPVTSVALGARLRVCGSQFCPSPAL